MNARIETINGIEFLRIELMEVEQKGKRFYLAKVPVEYILKTHTVEPANYDISKESAIAANFPDDEEYLQFRLDLEKKRKLDSKKFERREDPTRVSKIQRFLDSEEYALFPNTVIVTCDLMHKFLPIPSDKKIHELEIEDLKVGSESGLSFLEEVEDGTSVLYVPYKENTILVIDGQHRLKGLEAANKDKLGFYEILISLIIGFERSVVAELFYTINYTQKSVNKSLLYHLMGEFSREINEVTFMHEIVRILNELVDSPFYNRVKMLGTKLGSKDEKLTNQEKSRRTISQAFLIDYLKYTISSSKKPGIYPPIFLFYYRDEEKRIEIARFIIKYFKAISKRLSADWNNPNESILCNTLGVGAFIRVLHFLFVKMFIDELNQDTSRIIDVKVDDLVVKLEGIEKIDFSKGGDFGKGASAGSLNKLREKIVINMPYFEATSYDGFMQKYRKEYLPKYREWLDKHV